MERIAKFDYLKANDFDYVSHCGSKDYTPIEYIWSDETKCMIPVEGKKLDRFKIIQASKNSTDIAAIVQRAMAGDVSGLHVHPEIYADVSNVPSSLNELNEQKVAAVNSFYNMDPKIKALFGNDVSNFIKAVENGSYVDVINNALKVVPNEIKKDVKESEESK